jgi:hypothetical protein
VSGRALKINYSLESPATRLPTSNQAEAGLDRMLRDRGHGALMALARLLARQAAREFVSQK